MIWIVMGIAVWVACGIGAWGFTLAYFSRKYDEVWRLFDKKESSTFMTAAFVAVTGPIGLFVSILMGDIRYGWVLWA